MIMALSMAMSVVVFLVVVEIMSRQSQPAVGAVNTSVFRFVFYIVALSMIAVANIVRGFFLRRAQALTLAEVVAKLNTATVVTMGMSEIPVVMGFVLYMLTRSQGDFYIFALISGYLVVRNFPRYGAWETFARRQLGPGWATTEVPGADTSTVEPGE